MTIKTGDKFPSVTVKKMGAGGLEDVNVAEFIAGKKVILFAVPGAFTPSCHEKHLPGYIKNAAQIKSEGVDEIICVAVNDPFVMHAWGEATKATPQIVMMPDGNGELTKALGMDFDGSGAGLGTRSKRYAMVVEDGVVQSIEVEEKPSDVELSGAEACLINLKNAA